MTCSTLVSKYLINASTVTLYSAYWSNGVVYILTYG